MNFLDIIKRDFPLELHEFIEENEYTIESISNWLTTVKRITPDINSVLAAFKYVSFDQGMLFPNSLRLVMLFQDPYPGIGHACGIATMTQNTKPQPTLSNILKRIQDTVDPSMDIHPPTGDIRGWCMQGILLINCAFTTEETLIKAHIEQWQYFTKPLIQYISRKYENIVFAGFGADARKLLEECADKKHPLLSTSHPSGRGMIHGFNTSDIFNEINGKLSACGRIPINWTKYKYFDRSKLVEINL